MRTPQWIKKLGGHAGELYVAAELSKRGIPNALLPENFSDDDILIGEKRGVLLGYIQVKSCHPDRATSFLLEAKHEKWYEEADDNQFVVLVWLGSPRRNECSEYWIAKKKEVGKACIEHSQHGTNNRERRFPRSHLDNKYHKWKNNWDIFKDYMP